MSSKQVVYCQTCGNIGLSLVFQPQCSVLGSGVASGFYETPLQFAEAFGFNQNNELLLVNRDFLSVLRTDGSTQRLVSGLVQAKSAFGLSDGSVLIGERTGIRKLRPDGQLETIASTTASVVGLVDSPSGIYYTLSLDNRA
jgi:hypothetical protein